MAHIEIHGVEDQDHVIAVKAANLFMDAGRTASVHGPDGKVVYGQHPTKPAAEAPYQPCEG